MFVTTNPSGYVKKLDYQYVKDINTTEVSDLCKLDHESSFRYIIP